MLARRFFAEVRDIIDKVESTQMLNIAKAADILTKAIVEERKVFVFGCSHAAILAEELCYRAGGLALINPIFAPGLTVTERPITRTSRLERLEGYGKILVETTPIEKDDVLIIASTSGRNSVPVEMAIEAKKVGVIVIALTSFEYSKAVVARHSSGKRLYELADLVLDNCGVVGDVVLEVPGLPQKVGSTSNIIGSIILQSVIAETIENLMDTGRIPPVFASANLDEGEELNSRIFEKYRHLITYM